MTKAEMNYRTQKQTCLFCEHFDMLRDSRGDTSVVCFLSKEPIDDNGICDFYSPANMLGES
jgi:hypothetical protein